MKRSLSKKQFSIVFIVMFILFLGIMDYPFIVRWINERNSDGVIIEYREDVDNMSEKEKSQQFKNAREYNASLTNGMTGTLEAFGAQSLNERYKNILNINGSDMMGIVDIPKINAKIPVYHGTSDEVLQKGAGHLEGTSLPIGEKDTHSCISAHRGLPTKMLFTRLDELSIGDLFYIDIYDYRFAYRVTEIQVVEPDEIDPLRIVKGKELVTLITCTPYGINSHRMYVTGERTEYINTHKKEYEENDINWLREYWWLGLNIVLICFMGRMLVRFNNRRDECI